MYVYIGIYINFRKITADDELTVIKARKKVGGLYASYML